MSSVSGIHQVEKENCLIEVIVWPPHRLHDTCVFPQYKCINVAFKKAIIQSYAQGEIVVTAPNLIFAVILDWPSIAAIKHWPKAN